MDDTTKTSFNLTKEDRAMIAAVQRQLEAQRPRDSTERVAMIDAIRHALRLAAECSPARQLTDPPAIYQTGQG